MFGHPPLRCPPPPPLSVWNAAVFVLKTPLPQSLGIGSPAAALFGLGFLRGGTATADGAAHSGEEERSLDARDQEGGQSFHKFALHCILAFGPPIYPRLKVGCGVRLDRPRPKRVVLPGRSDRTWFKSDRSGGHAPTTCSW